MSSDSERTAFEGPADSWDDQVSATFDTYSRTEDALANAHAALQAVAGGHDRVRIETAERELAATRAMRDGALELLRYTQNERTDARAWAAAQAADRQAKASDRQATRLNVATVALVVAAFITLGVAVLDQWQPDAPPQVRVTVPAPVVTVIAPLPTP
ncbi:hypothetical protein [Cellulomonas sp. P5_C5]